MKKLRLEVEDLAVESFATAPATDAHGTVRGHEATDGCTVKAVCDPSFGDTACDLTWHCSNAAPLC